MLDACYRSGENKLAAKISASVQKDLLQQKRYYQSLDANKQANMQYENSVNENLIQALNEMNKQYNGKENKNFLN